MWEIYFQDDRFYPSSSSVLKHHNPKCPVADMKFDIHKVTQILCWYHHTSFLWHHCTSCSPYTYFAPHSTAHSSSMHTKFSLKSIHGSIIATGTCEKPNLKLQNKPNAGDRVLVCLCASVCVWAREREVLPCVRGRGREGRRERSNRISSRSKDTANNPKRHRMREMTLHSQSNQRSCCV